LFKTSHEVPLYQPAQCCNPRDHDRNLNILQIFSFPLTLFRNPSQF